MATPEDLAETVKEVEALDRRIVATAGRRTGLRPRCGPPSTRAWPQLGRLDIVCGQRRHRQHRRRWPTWTPTQAWQDMIDVNLTGVWHTVKAAVPHLIERRAGGSIMLTSSTAGLKGAARTPAHYIAAKHGVVGLMRTLAQRAGPAHDPGQHACTPPAVDTGMIQNSATYELFAPDLPEAERDQGGAGTPLRGDERSCRSRGSRRWTSPTRCCGWPPTSRVTLPV